MSIPFLNLFPFNIPAVTPYIYRFASCAFQLPGRLDIHEVFCFHCRKRQTRVLCSIPDSAVESGTPGRIAGRRHLLTASCAFYVIFRVSSHYFLSLRLNSGQIYGIVNVFEVCFRTWAGAFFMPFRGNRGGKSFWRWDFRG